MKTRDLTANGTGYVHQNMFFKISIQQANCQYSNNMAIPNKIEKTCKFPLTWW